MIGVISLSFSALALLFLIAALFFDFPRKEVFDSAYIKACFLCIATAWFLIVLEIVIKEAHRL